MVDIRSLWQFDPAMARVLWTFILQPCAGMHPDRLARLWPGHPSVVRLIPEGEAALSRALMGTLELNDQVELDLDQPLHRCALMPYEGLAVVARQIELQLLAPRLRRIILRRELELLQPVLGPDEWAMALDTRLHESQGLAPGELEDLPVDEVLALFDQLGWVVLDAALGQLHPSVARRAQLKLPVMPAPPIARALDVSRAEAIAQTAYPTAQERWQAGWDDAWLSRRAA